MTGSQENRDGNGGDEQGRHDEGRARDARVRKYLEFIAKSSKEGGASMILGALAPLAIEKDGAEAYEMAVNAVVALVHKDPRALAAARKFYAEQRGCDASQHGISIVKLHDAVDAARAVVQSGDTKLFPEKHTVLETLAEHINSAFGPPAHGGCMPSPADLERWISQHSPRSAKGKMTTAGIVAAIIHQGRLLGARSSLSKTRDRVYSALRRREQAERVLRGDATTETRVCLTGRAAATPCSENSERSATAPPAMSSCGFWMPACSGSVCAPP